MVTSSSWRIFWQFLKRDIYIHAKRLSTYLINFVLLYPMVYIICYGYIQARSYFGVDQPTQSTIFFCGTILLLIMSLTFELTIGLLFDMENERTIDYRMILLDPKLVLLEQIVFTSGLTFLLMAPFFPVAKLFLGSALETTNASWPLIGLFLLLSCICFSAYHVFIACALNNSKQIVHLWMRGNWPMISMGGFWVPWYTMYHYSPVLGKLLLVNPVIYATEGIKHSFVPSGEFIPVGYCIGALILFSCIFIVAAWHIFKKKVDHI